MKRLFILLVIIFLSGCRSSSDIKLETAARVYVENLRLEEKYPNKPDTVKILRDKIFEKFKLSKEEYKKIFDGLSTDKDSWDIFFAASEKYLDSLKNSNSLN